MVVINTMRQKNTTTSSFSNGNRGYRGSYKGQSRQPKEASPQKETPTVDRGSNDTELNLRWLEHQGQQNVIYFRNFQK